MENPWKIHGKSMDNKNGKKTKMFPWYSMGSPGGPMGPHEESWVPMGPHASPWVPTGSHGSPWDPMGTHGDPWGPMETHYSTWGPMSPHGPPWGPMEYHGNIFPFLLSMDFPWNYTWLFHGFSMDFPFDFQWIFHGSVFHEFPMNHKMFPWWFPEPLLA